MLENENEYKFLRENKVEKPKIQVNVTSFKT